VLPHVRRLRPAGFRARLEPAKVAAFVSEKLATIEGVLSTATHFMLRSYKEHGFMLDAPAQENERLRCRRSFGRRESSIHPCDESAYLPHPDPLPLGEGTAIDCFDIVRGASGKFHRSIF